MMETMIYNYQLMLLFVMGLVIGSTAAYWFMKFTDLTNIWWKVIDEAMVISEIGVANPHASYDEAKRTLNSLICYHQDIAIYFHENTVPDPVEDIDWGQPNYPDQSKVGG